MKTQVFFKATAVLMTALLICACEKGEKDDYKLGQDLNQMVTVIADIGKDAGTKITLGEDLGSTTEMLWSPEDSIALTDGQKLYVFTRSDDSDVPTERAEFTYNGKAGSLPVSGTERLKFIYPVSAPEQYSQQSGTIAGLSEYMQMEAVIPEGTVSLGGLLLTFSHKTAVIKLELENEAFINQEASVIFAFRDLADGKDKTIKTTNLKADANGVVTAYLVHPAASVDDIHIYVKTSSALYETTLSPKQIIPGKLYKVRKNDFVQSNIGLEGMLPEGDIFRSAVEQLMLQNSSIVRIKFIAESKVDGTPIGDSDAVMVVNGDCLEIHTSASEFIFNEDCSEMFMFFATLIEIDFNDCINTSNVTTMWRMFANCFSLISLDLSSFDTSNVTDMSRMFESCRSLTSLDLSSFDTSNVADMSEMFCYCQSLTSVDLSSFDTSNVANMSRMFCYCLSLTSVDLSGFDTSNVANMSRMFCDCQSLTSVDLSSFDTSNVTGMSNMFFGCHSLMSLNVSSFSTSNVTTMGWMFSGCRSLASLDVSSFNTSNVTDMSNMFSNCQSLTSLDVSSFNTLNVTDMSLMFNRCLSLTSLDLTGFDFIKVKSFDGMFSSLGSDAPDKPVIISVTQEGYDMLKDKDTGIDPLYAVLCPINRSAGTLDTGVVFNSVISKFLSDNSSITRVKFIAESQKTGTSIVASDATMLVNGDCLEIHTSAQEFIFNEDCSGMFKDFTDLTEIDFNDCINTSNVTDMSQMFDGCRSLTTLDISSFDTSKVTDMSRMFSGCSFTSLDLSSFDTSNVRIMSGMFNGCRSLTTLDMSSFDTSNVTNMSSMFSGLTLTSLDLSSFDTSNVTDMSYMFYSCSITSLDLSSLDTSNVTDMSYMFSSCSIASLDLSSLDTSNVTDMSYMFSSCSIASLDLSGLNTSNVTDMSYMFYRCKSPTSLDLSSFDTSNVTTMSRMFSDCESLTSLDLSGFNNSNVTDMSYMFYRCKSLASLDLSDFATSNVRNMSEMFVFCESLTSLDLSSFDTSNVTDMSRMFRACKSLTSLDLSSFNTPNVTTMSEIFSSCISLMSLNVSSFSTSNVTTMGWMFSGCRSLASLDVSSFNTSNVTDMSYMFSNCQSLTSLDVSSFNTLNVTDMSLMFNRCLSLTSLDLTGFDFIKVKSFDGMFSSLGSNAPDKPISVSVTQEGYDILKDKGTGIDPLYAVLCYKPGTGTLATGALYNNAIGNLLSDNPSLKRVKFIAESQKTGTPIGVSGAVMVVNGDCLEIHTSASEFIFNEDCSSMFSDFTDLIEIDFNDCINTSNVTDMSAMFSNCRSLTSLDLTGFDFIKVKSFDGMFSSLGLNAPDKPICVSMTQEGYDILKDKGTGINSYYAVLCSIDRLDTGRMFNEAVSRFLTQDSSIKRIKFIAESQRTGTPIGVSGAVMVVNGDCLEIHTSAPEFIFNKNCSSMFSDFTDLIEIDFNDCINTSNVTNMSDMFFGCRSLTSLNLTGFDTSNVTYMYGVFSGCKSLTSLDLSGFDTSNVTNMSSMFSQCQSLISVNLSGFDTSNVTDMRYMFSNCQSLTSLDLSSFDTSNVTDMRYMFDSCQSLTSLDLSGFDTSNVTDMSYMFDSCHSLTSLDLSVFDTSNVTNMRSMFLYCRSLTSLDLTSFDFIKVKSFDDMFRSLGLNAPDKPINVSVTQEGYDMLKDKDTGISPLYAVLCSTNHGAGMLATLHSRPRMILRRVLL